MHFIFRVKLNRKTHETNKCINNLIEEINNLKIKCNDNIQEEIKRCNMNRV